jgi:hypothetical protein
MKKAFGFLILSFTLFGCPGVIDSISRTALSGGYFFDETNLPVIYRDTPTHKYIPAVVQSYAYDSEFIIATQKDSKICNEQLQQDYTYDDCIRLLDKLAAEPHYWIISHAEDSVYGPLSSKEYLNFREVLHVPKNLRFKD